MFKVLKENLMLNKIKEYIKNNKNKKYLKDITIKERYPK
jgi:hypothetical protein